MNHVIVLNADYSFLNTIHWKRAIILLFQDKVEIVKQSGRKIMTAGGELYPVPLVVKLIQLVDRVFKNKVCFSKRNVFVRDKFKCQYCGKNSMDLTIDHVMPWSRGGKTNFSNCVAACYECNQSKGDRTPEEAHMRLIKEPEVPNVHDFLRIIGFKLNIQEHLKDF